MIRYPAVSGRFYPEDPALLSSLVVRLLPSSTEPPLRAFGVVSPHAGYVYSGAVAAATLASVEITPTVLILCPKHTRLGAHTSIMAQGRWELPGGALPIDEALASHLLARLPGAIDDIDAHRGEHSLEVQLPFLRQLRPDVQFVPLALGFRSYRDCHDMGLALAQALADWPEPVLILASSDMNHFEDHARTLPKDQLAIERFLDFDPQGLFEVCEQEEISMCGVVPATIMLLASRQLGAKDAELIQHTTSGEISGDFERVVGYAGMVVR